jgi:uncharacterized protein YdaU (DUF1376 family)
MKKERGPSMQFYFRQFSGDEQVMAMDLETVGAHILLMCAAGASSHGYRLPSDERMIRNIIRAVSDGRWKRIKQQLLQGAWKISADGKWWEQTGMRRSYKKSQVFRKLQSEKGKRGAEARWQDGSGHQPDTKRPCVKNGSSSSSSSLSQIHKPTAAAPPHTPCGNVENVKPLPPDLQAAANQMDLADPKDRRNFDMILDERRRRELLAPVAAKRSV